MWVGASRAELKVLPREVQRTMGNALWFAQNGRLHPMARPLRGRTLAGVMEIREDYDRNTYRLMYVAKLGEAIYVLSAFQKKSTKGIGTPQHLLELVAARLQLARRVHALRMKPR